VNVSNASVPVHEQGTANVNVTNNSLSVAAPAPVTGGAAEAFCAEVSTGLCSVGPYTAFAIQIVMTSGVSTCALLDGANQSVIVLGPEQGGNSDVEIPLSRPITFDAIKIVGNFGDECSVGMVGDSP
jgi:hypothetical protein